MTGDPLSSPLGSQASCLGGPYQEGTPKLTHSVLAGCGVNNPAALHRRPLHKTLGTHAPDSDPHLGTSWAMLVHMRDPQSPP